MRSFIRILSFALLLLTVLPVQAQLLDQMVTVQAATTSVGRRSDSAMVIAQPGRGEGWETRVFTAKTSGACLSGGQSAIGIANGGTGITNVDVRNARGEVSITWKFGKGIPAANFPYSAFEFVLANTSPTTEIRVQTAAILSTNHTDVTIAYPGVRVSKKFSPHGKVIPFRFESASSSLLKNPTTVIRSLTLRLSSPASCDSSFSVQLARFARRPIDKSKSKSRTSGRVGRASTDSNVPVQGTATATATPASNPCETDPTVPEQIRECEEKSKLTVAECATVECKCVPFKDNSGYSILRSSGWISNGSDDSTGRSCTNRMCGGIQGKCSDFGECIPAQFFGYDNPSISVGAEGVSYRIDDPQTQLDSDCFDDNKQPRGARLCNMTIAQLEEEFLASMKVGAPCELSTGKAGVCSNFGQCIPDVNGTYFCRDQVDCSPCGAKGNICWRNECLSVNDASRKLCESTHVRGGGRGICSRCFATFKLNPDGVCGTGVIAPDARGVPMDGAPCSRDQSSIHTKGVCRDGQCVLTPVATASPSASPGS